MVLSAWLRRPLPEEYQGNFSVINAHPAAKRA